MSNDLPDVQYNSVPNYPYAPPPKNNNTGVKLIFGCLGMSCLCLCLICCILPSTGVIGVGAVAALFLSNGVSQTGTETIRLESEGTGVLQINDSNTTVNISSSITNDITVDYELTVYSWSESAAQDELAKYQVVVDRQGDTITLSVDNSDSGVSLYDLTANITVPAEMQEIRITTDDAVSIDGVQANFIIDSNMADTTLTNVSGQFDVSVGSFYSLNFTGNFDPKSFNRLETSSGDMSVSIQGKAHMVYSAQTSGLGEVSCPDTRTSSTSCDGRLGDANVQLDLISSGGDITLIATR